MANSVSIAIEHQQFDGFDADSLKFEGVTTYNEIFQSIFDKGTLSPAFELAILDQLEKQLKNRIYDFNQY